MAGSDTSDSQPDPRVALPGSATPPSPTSPSDPTAGRATPSGGIRDSGVEDVEETAGSRWSGTRFVFVDTETTGLDFARHQLTEVAWIVRLEDGREETRCFVPEHTLDGADEKALELTDYHARIAPQPRSPASEWLVQFLSDAEGAVLVGAVPDFDARHLERAAARIERTPTWDHHLLDVETLALPLISPGPEAPRSLAKTCRALGIPHDKDRAHGALYDAQQAMRVFDRVYELLASLRSSGAPLPPPVPRNGHAGSQGDSGPTEAAEGSGDTGPQGRPGPTEAAGHRRDTGPSGPDPGGAGIARGAATTRSAAPGCEPHQELPPDQSGFGQGSSTSTV